MTRILLFLIQLYQKGISPLIGANCRYTPTCSEYATHAVKKFGPLKGSWLAIKRIISCNPWGGHGYDPLP
jgi:putative membrane protein insertion efficiency factor